MFSVWPDAYKKETGNTVNYQSVGSGAGIKQILAKTVIFGATDAPLKAEALEKDGLVQCSPTNSSQRLGYSARPERRG